MLEPCIPSTVSAFTFVMFAPLVLVMVRGSGVVYDYKDGNSINSKNSKDFYYNLSKDKKINSLLKNKELKFIFNNKTYLKNIDVIYKRIFNI